MDVPAVHAEVSYRLGEYRALVSELMPYVNAAKKKGAKPGSLAALKDIEAPGVPVSAPHRWLVLALASAVFFYKIARVGTCVFTINGQGITRKSKTAPVSVPWADVIRVFRFSRGYLVVKQEGAMPIPYRCLSDDERAQVEQILARAGH